MAAKEPPPIEIANALAAIADLRDSTPDLDHDALAKTLPQLARRLAGHHQDCSIEALTAHAVAGVAHIGALYETLGNPIQKNKPQKTYDEIISPFLQLPPYSPPQSRATMNRITLHTLGQIETTLHDGKIDADEAFQQAAASGHLSLVQYLAREHKVDICARSNYAIRHAATGGHAEIVEFLIQHGSDVNAQKGQALRNAVTQGHFDVVKILVQNKADIHADSDSALMAASLHGRADIIRFLINHGADIHAQNEQALRNAIKNPQFAPILLLLECGADISTLTAAEKDQLDRILLWKNMHNMLPNALIQKDPTLVKQSTLNDLHKIYTREGYGDDLEAWVYAYNTAVLFGTTDRALKYFEKWHRESHQPLHNCTHMICIPSQDQIHAHEKPNIKAWGDAAIQIGPDIAKYARFSHRLPTPAQDSSGRFWSLKNTKASVAEFAFKNAHKNPAMAAIALDCAWDNEILDTALALIDQYWSQYAANDNKKPASAIPEITIDGDTFGKTGFTFSRLPDGDIRGLALGAFTACCQHLGGEGHQCAKNGFLSAKAAFYVVTHDKTDQIVAQSWAWRGTQNELVLDSLEYLPSHMNPQQWKQLCIAFATAARDHGIKTVLVGTNGNTPKTMGFPRSKNPATPVDYDGYRDSRNQYVISR